MMKKVLTALLGAVPVLMMSAFALTVDLNLFSGGLSVLDSLLLIGIGLALIGVLLLCIAFLKPVKVVPEEEPVAEPAADIEEEAVEEEPSVEQAEESVDETNAEVSEEPETEAPEEAATAGEAEETEAVEEEVPVTPEADEVAEEVAEKVYPTLTLTGINNGEFMILPLKESVSLGRRPANDLVFSDTTISGVHCGITVEEDKVYLCDKDSTNGTFVNAKRISEKTELHKGDVLALGQLEFRVGL
ncbi:MAG: FHA domain-containing protein [Clostridia bacterium]|nr:FHA domain-containing protein [Clostridia bacterium]